MINELLFMETRLFKGFYHRLGIQGKKANDLFNTYGIWSYLESCYDTLHTNGDDYILDDIISILKSKGAAV